MSQKFDRPVNYVVGDAHWWNASTYSEEWYKDALKEAKMSNDQGARRREIIFAVCFAEAYLVEWVRDDIFPKDLAKFNRYFPPDTRRGVFQKWKSIPKKLKRAGIINSVPNRNDTYWNDWKKLVDYRNGLVHARSSRPESSRGNEPIKKNRLLEVLLRWKTKIFGSRQAPTTMNTPWPTRAELASIREGWATEVVYELVSKHVTAAGKTPPSWLIRP